MTDQLAIPVSVTPDEVAREKTLGGAIELCAKVAGFDLDKQLQQRLGVDKAQFSRWQSGEEGIKWPKLSTLMDHCGNNAPVDRKSTRLNSSHPSISYAVFCLKKKKK